MRVRHFFKLAVIILVAFLHFAVQWYAWKVHRFEIPIGDSVLGPPADYLWRVCSWPMFDIVSRRVQHLHFLAILLANSFTWGVAFVGAATACRRFAELVLKRTRKKRAESASQRAAIRTSPPTRVERIIELNSMLNRKRITEEEYRAMRKGIMRERDPEPDSVRPHLAANTAVTYSVPADVNGAAHVAWLDDLPQGVRKNRAAEEEPRRERATIPPTSRPAGRDR